MRRRVLPEQSSSLELEPRRERAHVEPRDLVAVALDRLRPLIDAVMDELRVELENLIVATVAGSVASRARPSKLGEFKRCRVCGLPGARNRADLAPGHTREEHEQQRPAVKVKPPTVRMARAPFDAPRSTTPRRWQRA
jgi:hypothetical protein